MKTIFNVVLWIDFPNSYVFCVEFENYITKGKVFQVLQECLERSLESVVRNLEKFVLVDPDITEVTFGKR